MAVTKIWAIHDSVSRVVDYSTNPSKTKLSDLEQVLLYAADKEKTLDEGEQQYAVTGIGCRAESAAREMAAVQRRFGKAGGNVAYHAHQSFKTGEVTAEECHRIGVETARRLWGNDRQVLVATHFNTGTYHNHFVVNPVNMWTGKKLEAKYEVYYKLRDMSDRVCKEHGLSVVKNPQRHKTARSVYFAEKDGEPTRYNLMRRALDEALTISSSWTELSAVLRKKGYLDEITGGRGIVFATGTPISNSMVELYTIQRYLQMSALEEQGLQHFDSWAANYGETVTAIELSPEGTGYRAKTRFAKFYNLPELMSVFKNVADIQTADMLKLPVPEAHYHNIALKPSEYQKEIVASLAERAEKVRNREVDSSVDNMLLITNDGRKLALDQRLVNPMLPSDPNSKAAKCAENVFEIWQRTADKRSTQMIFCDLSTPKDDGTFSVYDDIRAKLLELGVPENEIAFIHNAKSEVQKKDLFGKVRSGQVRILLGSTQRMGAGTNCQQKLVALHHLDCPWRPSDLQQREGRIIRQGNENPEVDIYSYVTEGTFDAYLYQLVESKQKFISQIMTSKSPVRSAEDVDEQALSYAEIKALASGNPMIKEKMDLDIEVSKLKLLKANHLSQKYALEDAISKGFPKQIAETQARIAGYGADIATVKENTHPNGDGFSPLTLAGVTYADKKEAGAALLTMCQTMLSPEATQIGSYRGLTLELAFDTFAREYRLTMIGQLRHTVTLGTDVFGNLQRMDNALEGLPIKEQTCREQLSNLQTQLETAKTEVQKPFPREAELNTKTARLEELNSLLNLDHKEPEIVDAEPDEDQRPPERRRPQLER